MALLCEHKAAVDVRALLSQETALHRAANEGKLRESLTLKVCSKAK